MAKMVMTPYGKGKLIWIEMDEGDRIAYVSVGGEIKKLFVTVRHGNWRECARGKRPLECLSLSEEEYDQAVKIVAEVQYDG